MGLREKEIRSESDLPPMLNRNCDLHLYRRGEVPDAVFSRLEIALSFHYHRALEGAGGFTYGERPRPEPISEVLGAILADGYRISVSGAGTPRMNFYVSGTQRAQGGTGD